MKIRGKIGEAIIGS